MMMDNLPDELISKIINYNDAIADIATCRLVCKRWDHIAEPLMFGKQITIRSEPDALSLFGHLFRNPRFGKLIKRIHFQESDINCALQDGLLRLVFTPNMEEMSGALCFGYKFYHTMSKIVKASTTTTTTKFDKLRVVPHPIYYSDIYDETLILFQHTLREMVLVLDSDHTQPGRGIVNHMMHFTSLVRLTLNGNLGSLFLMEDFLQHCLILEELTLHLHLTDNIHEKTFVENWAAPIVKPVSSVKKITFLQECRADQLEYIRIKYPQLKTLIINMNKTPLIFNRNNIKRIINAMISNVPTYDIKLLIKEEHLTDTIGNLLAAGCQFNIKEADNERFKIEMQKFAP